jgi:undecaprenyl-diphosphatase
VLHLIGIIAKATLAADVTLFKVINAHHAPFFDWLFLSLSYLGSGWVIVPLFLAYLLWRTLKSRQARIFIAAAAVLLISGLSNSAVKELVDRPRPLAYFVSQGSNTASEEGRLYRVHVLGEKFVNHSFPSGHANMAFTIATLALLIFGRQFWPAFLVAFLVAYSRVYVGVHFPLDTLAGACMGSVIALAVWHGLAKIARPSQAP